jgi:hypothetical protein
MPATVSLPPEYQHRAKSSATLHHAATTVGGIVLLGSLSGLFNLALPEYAHTVLGAVGGVLGYFLASIRGDSAS